MRAVLQTPDPQRAGLRFWGVGCGVIHRRLGLVDGSVGGGGRPGEGERGLLDGHGEGSPLGLPGGLRAGVPQQSRFLSAQCNELRLKALLMHYRARLARPFVQGPGDSQVSTESSEGRGTGRPGGAVGASGGCLRMERMDAPSRWGSMGRGEGGACVFGCVVAKASRRRGGALCTET